MYSNRIVSYFEETDVDYVYNILKKIPNMDVYLKSEIPEWLHYKKNVRIGDLLIATHLGYTVYINNETVNWGLNQGDHGYYNNESTMHPIFLAHGPAFKINYKTKSFNNVDIYPLMCLLLGVTPAINNGSIDNVIDMVVFKIVNYDAGISK
jgi:ectonucleotide pyrophosphatase/phosphodiesterase family member 5